MPRNVEWARGRKQEFATWLASEIFHAEGDRTDLEAQWADWLVQYDAPRRGSADIPFPGASNEELPLTAEHTEPVLAQFMQSLHAPRNLWTAVDLSGEFTDSVNAVTEFLTLIDRLYLKMRKVNQRVFPDLILLGTGIWHPTWLHERRKGRDADNNSIITVIDNPVCRHIPLRNFLWPANAWDVNPDDPVAPARWVGHRFKVTRGQLAAMSRGQDPFLPNYDKEGTRIVLEQETEEEDEVEKTQRDLDRYRPAFDRKIELYRVECRFDVDGDDIDEDVVVIFHHPTATILRATHQFWEHGQRLYEVEQYIRMFSLLGKGLGSMAEWAQAASSRLLNAGINNALIANTKMYGIPAGMNTVPGEAIYPGKQFPLMPGDKVQEIALGDIHPSIFQFLELIRQWQERRDSVSDLRTGNITGLPSRTPATTVLSLLQEGNKKFDMILSNIRQGAIANVGKRTLQMIAQRHQGGATHFAELAQRMLGEDAEKVIAVLDLPVAALEEGLGIEVTATSSQVNKEVEKQGIIGLAQFMMQAYAMLTQGAQLLGDQQLLAQTVGASYNGFVLLLKELLEAFDKQNAERFLPPQLPLQNMNGGQAGMGGGGAGFPLQPTPQGAQLQLLQLLSGLG